MADGNAAPPRARDDSPTSSAPAPASPPTPMPPPIVAAPQAAAARVRKRGMLRPVLLLLGPIVVIGAGLYFYLSGGRYIATDNTYIQADKVTISSEVAGTVAQVAVTNNQEVTAGQLLFRIEDEPYRIALASAKAQLAMVNNDISALKATYRQKLDQIKKADADLSFSQSEMNRQRELASRQVASQAKLDDAQHNFSAAQQLLAALRQEAAAVLAGLGGQPDGALETYPRAQQAQAAVDKAARDLRLTSILAPRPGVVANVDKLQQGAFLGVAQAAITLIAADSVWVEANPKESELTFVRPGNPATVTVDTYPGRSWPAVVESISPATGAQFSVLPPQNSSGNWVKVVQRIPVRLRITKTADGPPLRAGMSAAVEIDTGHQRTLADLF